MARLVILSTAINVLYLGHVVLANDVALIEKLIARKHSLGNLIVAYEHRVEYNPDGHVNEMQRISKSESTEPFVPHHEDFRVHFRILGSAIFYETKPTKETLQLKNASSFAKFQTQITTMSPKRWEVMSLRKDGLYPTGAIVSKGRVPEFCILDSALGLRLDNSDKQLTELDLQSAQKLQASGDLITVSLKDESGTTRTLVFDAKFDYALINYLIQYSEADTSEEIQCSDFRSVNGLKLPFKVEKKSTYRDSTGKLRNPIVSTIVVTEYRVNDSSNTPESMMIHWPKGSRLGDHRNNNEQFEITSETGEVLTDEKIFQHLQEKIDPDANKLEAAQRRIDEIRSKPATRPAGQD